MNLAKLAGRLSLAFATVVGSVTEEAVAQQSHNIPWQADSHIVFDSNRDITIASQDADELRYPASLTKLMTLAVLFEALDNGQVSLNTALPVSAQATQVSHGGIKLRLQPGDCITVEDAITAITVKSFNDVAQIVAENLGGSQSSFVDLMNQKARAIGMSRSYFTNPTGLPDNRQVTTARDMATLCDYLIETYPQYYHFFGKTSFSYDGKTHDTHNRLMKQYSGMDGLKTGYIRASGFNLAASAERNGERVISIAFGHPSSSSRNQKVAQLLDMGFKEIEENKKPAPEELNYHVGLLFADIRSTGPRMTK